MGTDQSARADALRELSREYGAGRLTDAQYEAAVQSLDHAARVRKPAPPPREISAPTPCPVVHPVGRRGPARREPGPSLERRRRHAARGAMPPNLACRFTLSEQAVLAVVAGEIQRKGLCDLAVAHIAALAGVSETSVRNAIKQARRLLLVRVEERRVSAWRNDTNVVRVISAEWNVWLAKRSGGGFKRLQSTDTKNLEQGFSGSGVAASAAPGLDSRAPRKPGPCRNRKRH